MIFDFHLEQRQPSALATNTVEFAIDFRQGRSQPAGGAAILDNSK
jgi:hypothetical protein